MSPLSLERKGVLYALGAYVSWGLFPGFWKLFQDISSVEVTLHRWTWSTIFFMLLLRISLGSRVWLALAEARRAWRTLALTGALIAVNWLVYVYAVNSGQVLQGSLGYFLSPLVQMLLGAWVLGERVRPKQKIAAGLAFVGVVIIAFGGTGGLAGVPWIALILASTFSFYGLVRKRSGLEPLLASTFETLLYLPLALFALGYSFLRVPDSGEVSVHGTSLQFVGLIVGGALTGLPLLWYTEAAKRLPLQTVGFIQYVSPSLQFLLAVLIYREPLGAAKLAGFAVIWAALAVYVFDFFRPVSFPTRATKTELVS